MGGNGTLNAGIAAQLDDSMRIILSPAMTGAYAAVIGAEDARCFDDRDGGPLAHPLLAALLPQRLMMGLPQKATQGGGGASIFSAPLHRSQSLRIHRALRTDTPITIAQHFAGAHVHPQGALVTFRYAARDAEGALFDAGITLLLRGVAWQGEEVAAAPARPPLPGTARETAVPVARGLPWLYDAVSGVPFPIHTSRRAATAAGLPDVILQGSATLALTVGAILRDRCLAPAAIGGLDADFRAPVHPGCTLTVAHAPHGGGIAFAAHDSQGRAVVAGLLQLSDETR